MSLSRELILGRAISAFAVSVGTSLALESIFISDQPSIDPDRIPPQKVNIGNYDEFWINIATLFRNLIGALPKEGANSVSSPDIKEALINEMAYIADLVSHYSERKTNTIFYVCEYKKIEAMESKFIMVRKDNTVNQKNYRALLNKTLQDILNSVGKDDNVRLFDSDINVSPKGKPAISSKKCRAIILTHNAFDLTSQHRFANLDLIESHSGVLKKRAMFYTKYLNGNDLPMIPFMRSLLPVFGDRENFSPIAISIRKALLDLAVKNRWTQLTTIAKIKDNLNQLPNKFMVDTINSII